MKIMQAIEPRSYNGRPIVNVYTFNEFVSNILAQTENTPVFANYFVTKETEVSYSLQQGSDSFKVEPKDDNGDDIGLVVYVNGNVCTLPLKYINSQYEAL